ncbi:hypothetical protein C8R46DRAFT_955297 [Mycena filopes]|nr:hypothetical protein C8R46DRAFT_955297 [Mycena filopes]
MALAVAPGIVLNNSPTGRESNDDLRAHASRLDSEIAALRAQLDNLLTDRAVVQKELDALTYPVLTLPFEITSNIFRSTLSPRDPDDPAAAWQQSSLRLGHICRLWRQIALATRELWNTLDLTLDYPSPRSFEAQQSLTRTFLSRAASSSLKISLDGDQSSFRTMWDILIPYSRTWADISFHCAELGRLEGLPSIHHQLPALTTLKLALGGSRVPELGDGPFHNMFNDAPRLRSLSLSHFGAQESGFPWSQLTSLSLSECSGDCLARILGWTPNLIDLIVGPVLDPIVPQILPLPKLQSVIFGDGWDSSEMSVLSLLDARLRALKLWTCNDLAPFTPPMLHPTSLEQLSVDILCDDWVSTPSIECLTPMSSLRVLRITAHDYDPASRKFSLVPFLLRLIEDPAFLPKLVSLSITVLALHSRGAPEFDTDTLTNMLCVRFTKGLHHFDLRSRRPVPALDFRATDLRAKGMQIILETEPGLSIDAFREEF